MAESLAPGIGQPTEIKEGPLNWAGFTLALKTQGTFYQHMLSYFNILVTFSFQINYMIVAARVVRHMSTERYFSLIKISVSENRSQSPHFSLQMFAIQ